MREIFTKLGESVKTTYKEVSSQTLKTLDQTKMRSELSSLKNELKKNQQQLGELYFNYVEYGELFDNTLLIDKIKEVTENINEIEQLLNDIADQQKGSFDDYKDDLKQTWQQHSYTYQKGETYETEEFETENGVIHITIPKN
ncbi:MAG: hypothetical protein ATN35_13515 [Epulopiscium sp. Nele67-Bin004]|nr:MAG: hypothetical protein ATN35_13515 [Epulopiscium sp. Nele67-Bin004]